MAIEKRERNRTIILNGREARLHVQQDRLMISEGRTHTAQQPITHTLLRGQHDVSKILLMTHAGTVTFQALAWCASESICVLLLNQDGSVLYSLTPTICPDVARKQQPP